jgi:sirohydrochlorin cobaltochelatase
MVPVEPKVEGKKVVVLVGHGGVPKDLPRAWIREMKQLFRQAEELGDPGLREQAELLEQRVRSYPRTDATDPYRAGIRALAERLRAHTDWHVVVAFNEFCAPTIEEAIAQAVADGAARIQVMTTMITPGGSHSEIDIPRALEVARAAHPGVVVDFAWPMDLELLAAMYAGHLNRLDPV